MTDQLKSKIELVAGTKNMNMKAVIRFCGCSKSHFYQVMAGNREAGEELKQRLAAFLDCPVDALPAARTDEPLTQTRVLPPNQSVTSQQRWKSLVTSPRLWSGVIVVSLLLGIAVNALSQKQKPAQPIPADNGPLYPGDNVAFVKDVTVPDGTPVKMGTTFSKTWRIRNTGTVSWQNRALVRLTPQDERLCTSADRVEVAKTAAGQEVDITVEFVAPWYPGSCRTDWKMVDQHGQFVFPDKVPLYSLVQVTI